MTTYLTLILVTWQCAACHENLSAGLNAPDPALPLPICALPLASAPASAPAASPWQFAHVIFRKRNKEKKEKQKKFTSLHFNKITASVAFPLPSLSRFSTVCVSATWQMLKNCLTSICCGFGITGHILLSFCGMSLIIILIRREFTFNLI